MLPSSDVLWFTVSISWKKMCIFFASLRSLADVKGSWLLSLDGFLPQLLPLAITKFTILNVYKTLITHFLLLFFDFTFLCLFSSVVNIFMLMRWSFKKMLCLLTSGFFFFNSCEKTSILTDPNNIVCCGHLVYGYSISVKKKIVTVTKITTTTNDDFKMFFFWENASPKPILDNCGRVLLLTMMIRT